MVSTTTTRSTVSTNINDNTSGDVTPADVRTCFVETLDDIDTLFTETKAIEINAQTGTSYTVVSGDAGKLITVSNASAATVTFPNSLAVGFTCSVARLGAGAVTLVGAGGSNATLNSRDGLLTLAGQYAAASVTVLTNSNGTSAVALVVGDVA